MTTSKRNEKTVDNTAQLEKRIKQLENDVLELRRILMSK